MKKYDSYKNSGIEWIGEIPIHWNVARLKFNSRIKTGYTPPMDNSENYSEDGMIWVKPDNLEYFKEILDSKEKVSVQGVKEQNIITKGSVLLCCIGTIGKFGIAGLDLLTNQQICGVTFIESLIPSFGKYLIYSSEEELNKHANGNVVRILNATSLGNIVYPIPTIEEQTTIANYLDQKTTQIDDLIAKKERLIQLLEEERTAIINQAVTKGLDPTVPMKDSGIDGLGLIPLNWKLMKFKMFAPILTCGVASTPEYVDESVGVPFLSAQNVKNNRMRLDNYKHISTDLHNSLTKNRKPQNGDILVTRVGAGIGDACIVDCNFEFSVYVSLTHIRVDESIVKNKLIMYFFSTDYCKYLNSQGTVTGGGVGNLNVNNVERYKVPIPPLEEQELIVDFITSKSTEIDKIVFKTQQEIELLKEYKTALISEVVTGKVDVRYEKLN